MIELNKTPVRTSKNFNINSIILQDLVIPEVLEEFQNVSIEKSKSDIETCCSHTSLTYGLDNILEENINKHANHQLKIKTVNNDTVKIDYTFDDDNLNLVNNIEIEAEGKSQVYIVYHSETNRECFHNGIVRLKANTNSKINVVIVNLMNEHSINFEAIENTLNENSTVKYTIVDFGAKTSISNYYSNIIGNNANNDLKTIYLGSGNSIKDINYIVHLRGEKSNIDIDVQGVLKDTAKKNFKGTIDFKKGCKKAIGNENEYCVLLSDKARSIALPMLLCTEEDVIGNHSTASGKIDSQSLFYIMSRGLSEQEAIQLLIKANFNKIIENIKDESMKDLVIQELEKRI